MILRELKTIRALFIARIFILRNTKTHAHVLLFDFFFLELDTTSKVKKVKVTLVSN